MKLGFKVGYHVPKCLSCLKYMHNPVEGGHSVGWIFNHCGVYWHVEYDEDKRVKRISDTVKGRTCYKCNGTGYYGHIDELGEYEISPCRLTLNLRRSD